MARAHGAGDAAVDAWTSSGTTSSRKELPVRKTYLALAFVSACLLAAGCFDSLTSIATPDKVVFDEGLVGEYRPADSTTGRLTLAKDTSRDKAYQYRQYDDKGALTGSGTLWVVKLGDETFYQIALDGRATADSRPVYTIGRLRIEGMPGAKTMTGYTFKSDGALFDDPRVKTERYEFVENGQRQTARAVSMPPAGKLQAYLADRAAEMTQPTLKYQQTRAGR
jgi:hypothetical protein